MVARLLRQLQRIVQFLAGATFVSVFGVNLLRILLRNVFGKTWFWIDGFSRLTFIWMVFLGATALYAANDHLVMDFLLDKLKPGARKVVTLLSDLVFLCFSMVLVYYGFLVFKARLGIPYTYWNVPTGWAYLAVPVNGFMMSLYCLQKLVGLARGGYASNSPDGGRGLDSPGGML